MTQRPQEEQRPGAVNGLLEFLTRRSFPAALLLIAFACLRIASTYPRLGITSDEPAHIACGMQYLAQHIYQYEAQHPPLARAMCALGPYLAGIHPAGRENMTEEGVALYYQGGNVAQNLVLSRLGTLPFFIAACLVVYFWGKRYFSPPAAVFATAIFTTTPVILAHAGLGTTDMALAAGMGASFLMLLIWAENPALKRGLWFGVVVGLTFLTKFSALLFLPVSALFALLLYLATARPAPRDLYRLARERASSFAAAVFTACIVIHAGYLFSFGEVPGWGVWLPAPEFFQGTLEVMQHNHEGHPAFFLGQLSRTGWWYYFPVMIVFKSPIALLLLLGLGLCVCWTRRRALAYGLPAALLLGVLLPSMAGSINIGTRHILPVFLAFALIAALALDCLLQYRESRQVRLAATTAAAMLTVWLFVSGALHHPDYLSYANELVRSPENLFADSDLDWGQGTVLVAGHLRQLHVSEVTCSLWYLTPDQLRVWPGLDVKPLDFQKPAPGWTAVSPTYWRLYGYVTHNQQVSHSWFADRQPAARAGGMLLYYVPPTPAP